APARRRRGRLRRAAPAREDRARQGLRAGGLGAVRRLADPQDRGRDPRQGRRPPALPRPARAAPRAGGVRLPVISLGETPPPAVGPEPPSPAAGTGAARPLDVVVVTTRFPAHAETFASARVRSLLEDGHRVRVMSFKAPAAGWEGLVAERGLGAAELLPNGPGVTAAGIAAAARRPGVLAKALWWLLSTCARAPVHLPRALAALPYAFWALDLLERDPPDVVHLDWGHYPTVVLPLVRWRGVPCVVSLSLVAYDIHRRFPGTRTGAHLADIVRTQARCNVGEIAAVTGIDPSRIEVVPDGVDLARIAAVAAGA